MITNSAHNKIYLSSYLNSSTEKHRWKTIPSLLEKYKLIIDVALETIDRLYEGKIPDPTVGENACQLRAVLYVDIFNARDFEELLSDTHNKIQFAKRNLDQFFLKQENKLTTLRDVLDQNQADVLIEERMHLLLLGSVVEKIRDAKIAYSMSEEGQLILSQEIHIFDGWNKNVMPPYAMRIIDKSTRRILSNYSILKLQEWSGLINDPEEKQRLYQLVSGENIKTTKLELLSAPFFSSTQIWLHKIYLEDTPLILCINRMDSSTLKIINSSYFFFRVDGNRYVRTSENSIEDKCAAIRFEAISYKEPLLSDTELETELDKRDIRESILASIATHPVYGGDCKNVEGPTEENDLRQIHAVKADEYGVSLENPAVFRLIHIYAVGKKQWKNNFF